MDGMDLFYFGADYVNNHVFGIAALPRQVVRQALAVLGRNDAFHEWLAERKPPVFFVGLDDGAFTWHLSANLQTGSAVIVLADTVLSKPVEQAAAVVAHELGHVWLRDHDQSTGGETEELAADAKAAEWGMKKALCASLTADLNDPRLSAKVAQIKERIANLS
jgi:hypothetical protein